MTLKASLTASRRDATRISDQLEQELTDDGVVVALTEKSEADGIWAVEVYYEEGDAEAIAADLDARVGGSVAGSFAVETLPETDWVAAGLADLKPVPAGRFLIHGSHDSDKLPGGRVPILIEAGQAFGTGHHGTTAGCLTVLNQLLRTRRFDNPLDVGTGSGVLAIALAKLLRRPVFASDIDPIAVRVAQENVVKNAVAPLVRTFVADGLSHPMIRDNGPFDLIVANILAEPLMKLAPAMAQVLAPGGTLVLSGLLKRQRERVVAAYSAQGIRLQTVHIFEGWGVLVLRSPSRSRPLGTSAVQFSGPTGHAWAND
ncbi:[LSU ribosomal protein L11P]-lysine N-methyltransferase [Faunimonas pinastri]|uniref:Ribosomal protein L11 methyltransferase n=1 Tax=Faunimonas pinastri TaxID=1855383 RepID=A0A1H9FPL9_9HYPH|nr:50S ribosomal protein L11 methyltransferase [Faunimonas pinastri]SEQ39842.1 [LSU ribosomal protein L11P]-lysine N-methyltransferase [Faunimonas pinastri]